jgi:hypothetical protein
MPIAALFVAVVLLASWAPATAVAAERFVDGAPGCSDAYQSAQVSDPGRAWCTIGRAASQAQAGDTVVIAAGVYRERVRFSRSGSAVAPIRFVGEPGVVVDGGGAVQTLLFKDVSDVELSGIRVTGGASEGVWVEGGARVALKGVDVSANPGSGVRVKAAAAFTLSDSVVVGNGGAGVMELAGTAGARYTGSEIRGNGWAPSEYNGDGIQLAGTGALVAGNRISANGSSRFEHGVYTGAATSGWSLEGNTFANNAGANVKAAGGPGVIDHNRMTGGVFGLILSDNPVAVDVTVNILEGRAQHLVFLTAGPGPARARLRGNTVVQTGRASAAGDASAVFVNAAASLELRNNVLCYQGADAFGISVMVNDPARLGSLVSDTNWFCARDSASRQLGWAGSRVSLASWRAAAGQDARSLSSWAPVFDADERVTSTNWGRDRGDWLGQERDFGGVAVPAPGLVDIGAWQS